MARNGLYRSIPYNQKSHPLNSLHPQCNKWRSNQLICTLYYGLVLSAAELLESSFMHINIFSCFEMISPFFQNSDIFLSLCAFKWWTFALTSDSAVSMVADLSRQNHSKTSVSMLCIFCLPLVFCCIEQMIVFDLFHSAPSH